MTRKDLVHNIKKQLIERDFEKMDSRDIVKEIQLEMSRKEYKDLFKGKPSDVVDFSEGVEEEIYDWLIDMGKNPPFFELLKRIPADYRTF